jgi:uncharacterized membrane protein
MHYVIFTKTSFICTFLFSLNRMSTNSWNYETITYFLLFLTVTNLFLMLRRLIGDIFYRIVTHQLIALRCNFHIPYNIIAFMEFFHNHSQFYCNIFK